MSAKTPSLTLILAATPSLGIGKNGQLPWPMLKKEMAYFARVTKRVPPPDNHNDTTSTTSTATTTTTPTTPAPPLLNAVIMGRKTWDSIPERLRPLKGRLNVVLTRDVEGFEKRLATTTTTNSSSSSSSPKAGPNQPAIEGPLVHSSILSALAALQDTNSTSPTTSHHPNFTLHNTFIIGGASLYRTALELPATKHILLTKIHREYDCDTFFSLNVEKTGLWRRAGRGELERFVGETVVANDGGSGGKGGEEEEEEEEAAMMEEQGVKFEFCLFEKVEV